MTKHELAVKVLKLNFPYLEMIAPGEGQRIIFSGESEETKKNLEGEYDRLHSLETYFNNLGYSLYISDDPIKVFGILTP